MLHTGFWHAVEQTHGGLRAGWCVVWLLLTLGACSRPSVPQADTDVPVHDPAGATLFPAGAGWVRNAGVAPVAWVQTDDNVGLPEALPGPQACLLDDSAREAALAAGLLVEPSEAAAAVGLEVCATRAHCQWIEGRLPNATHAEAAILWQSASACQGALFDELAVAAPHTGAWAWLQAASERGDLPWSTEVRGMALRRLSHAETTTDAAWFLLKRPEPAAHRAVWRALTETDSAAGAHLAHTLASVEDSRALPLRRALCEQMDTESWYCASDYEPTRVLLPTDLEGLAEALRSPALSVQDRVFEMELALAESTHSRAALLGALRTCALATGDDADDTSVAQCLYAYDMFDRSAARALAASLSPPPLARLTRTAVATLREDLPLHSRVKELGWAGQGPLATPISRARSPLQALGAQGWATTPSYEWPPNRKLLYLFAAAVGLPMQGLRMQLTRREEGEDVAVFELTAWRADQRHRATWRLNRWEGQLGWIYMAAFVNAIAHDAGLPNRLLAVRGVDDAWLVVGSPEALQRATRESAIPWTDVRLGLKPRPDMNGAEQDEEDGLDTGTSP